MNLLILSGFEATGMVGLLADDRLANSLQVPCAAIATGQTAQTEQALVHASATDPDLLQQQLASLHQPPSVVKIGVIFDRTSAQVIANWLGTLSHTPTVVLDPVGLSSGDGNAFSTTPLAERLAPLLPWVSLLTPNADEAIQLTGTADPKPVLDALQANHELRFALILTGGHSQSETDNVVSDRLLWPDD